MALNIWRKISLLLWKNWIIEKHHKIQLLFEIIFPAVFVLFLVFQRISFDPEIITEPTIYESEPLDRNFTFLRMISDDSLNFVLAYSPKNLFTNNLMNDVGKNLNVSVIGFNNSKLLEQYLKNHNIIAGVEFNNNWNTKSNSYPKNLNYKLRFPRELREFDFMNTWQTDHLYHHVGNDKAIGPSLVSFPSYIHEGFIPVQHQIALSFIKLSLINGSNFSRLPNLPEIEFKKFPYPPYKKDIFNSKFSRYLASFIVMGYSFLFLCAVKYITDEKEKQLKEFMKIMGLENWLHWTSWFLKIFLIFETSNIVLVIVMKIHKENQPSIIHNIDWSVMYFLLTIYGIATITFSFMMSTLFSRSTTAASVSGIFWYLTYFQFYLIHDNYESLNLMEKLGCCLFSNTALGFAINLLMDYQIAEKNFSWNNLWSPVRTNDLCIGHVILMLIFDSILYMLITLYIEKVFPGKYGIPYVWYYPFTSKYWCNDDNTKESKTILNHEMQSEQRNLEGFEKYPVYKRVGIKIKGLEKKYNGKTVVKDLFMNTYQGEITALLGHNGAGKSTIMSILNGFVRPTSGTAIINGHDIRKNMSSIRESLGLCPQKSILFDDLTPKEHLIFYSKLKGMNDEYIENEIDKYLRILELEDKSNESSIKLSGGMKRKLSVLISLCGKPKVILMDEPTIGMDPSVRRKLWNLLQTEKHDKTILISTHFMDEADVLGDRIAILCNGQLKCYGTSFFLKKKFGTGYHLVCVKTDDCDTNSVTELLRKYIPEIKIISEVSKEIIYELSDKYSQIFESMLGELEAVSNKIGLSGYGISLSSLEEVFMKIGKEKTENNVNSNSNENENDEEITPFLDVIAQHGPLEKEFSLFKSRLKAILLKKYILTIRNLQSLFIQILLSVLWTLLILLGAYLYKQFSILPLLPITLDLYPNAIVILEVTKYVKKYTIEWNIGYKYTELLLNDIEGNYELVSVNDNLQNYFLERAANDIFSIEFRYAIGASIDRNKITAWYNNEMLHTAPLSLHLIHNAIVKNLLGNSYNIDVSNYPQSSSSQTRFDDKSFLLVGYFISIYITFGMSFLTSHFAIIPIREKVCGVKLLQFIAGMTSQIYWVAAYIWDLILYTLIAILYIIIFGIFQPQGYSTFEELARLFLVLICFGIAVISFTYLISKLFNNSSLAISRIWSLNVLLGPTLFIIVFILSQKTAQPTITWLFKLIPHYSLIEALFKLCEISLKEKICLNNCSKNFICDKDTLCKTTEKCCNLNFISWSYPGILSNLLYFFITGLFSMVLLVISDLGYMDDCFSQLHDCIWKPVKPVNDDSTLEDDVKIEKEKIKNLTVRDIKSYNVVLDRVIKFYRKVLAVNEVSVAINSSECFGLLGVNGAGKTTTFKMMTGEEVMSSGEIYLKGNKIRNNLNDIRQETGYCPQQDALLDELTGRELLRIFCYIRGVPTSKTERLCMQLTKDLDFYKYLNERIKSYSDGTKRKLNTALAMIGNPSIIFLDEPSAGMDPSSKRSLWNMICRIRDSGRTIILTSHSMEECENLCTRLAIMVNGQFKCLGSVQHLKNKFSKGIVLKIKLKNRREEPSTSRGHVIVQMVNGKPCTEFGIARLQSVPEEYPTLSVDIENISRFIAGHFSNASLSEHYDCMLTFHIPLTNIRWSKVFGLLENNKDSLNLEDYSISQTSLEEIFLDFANQQRSE